VTALSVSAAKPDQALEFSRAAEAVVLRAGDPPILRGKLLAARGRALEDGGKPQEAVAALEPAVALLEQQLGDNSGDTIAALSRLAGAETKLGEFAKARATYHRILESARSLGIDTPREAAARAGLGFVEEHSGHYAEARSWFEESLAIYTRRMGPENLTVANVETNLANIDQVQGKLEDSAARYLKVKEMLEKVGGKDLPSIAEVLNNLASVRLAQGRIAEALALREEALARAEKNYGKDHPKYALFEDQYASALLAKGQVAAARARLEHAVAVSSKALGPDDPETLALAADLAEADARLGRCARVRPTLEKIVAAAQEKQLGEIHALATTLQTMGHCEVEAHDLAAAQKHYARAVEILKTRGSEAEVKKAEAALADARGR
jgi:tetratricopeptide (TPR) repeat protein